MQPSLLSPPSSRHNTGITAGKTSSSSPRNARCPWQLELQAEESRVCRAKQNRSFKFCRWRRCRALAADCPSGYPGPGSIALHIAPCKYSVPRSAPALDASGLHRYRVTPTPAPCSHSLCIVAACSRCRSWAMAGGSDSEQGEATSRTPSYQPYIYPPIGSAYPCSHGLCPLPSPVSYMPDRSSNRRSTSSSSVPPLASLSGKKVSGAS